MSNEFIGHYSYTKDAPLKTIVDYYSATVTYVGIAQRGTLTSAPQWIIKKLVQTGTIDPLQTDAVASNGSFEQNIWDDRLSLTYV